ncbi:MAG: DUF1697 domain-containing protein [Vicinamibacterales bacterium]
MSRVAERRQRPPMPRYAAFLRSVSPMNAKMAALKQAFEAAGFTEVKTVLSSGNVVFATRAASERSLQRKAEAAMLRRLGQSFVTIVRPIDALRELLESDPYRSFRLDPAAKRIVTFLREKPTAQLKLPIEFEGARISVYVPNPKGPVFMALIERTFGKEVTTRTWETVAKVAR